jgi:hypothetical protein
MNEKDKKDMEEFKKYFGKCKGRYYGHATSGGGSMVYCLGVIGALIFFIGNATTFWAGVLGFFQALVWPAFLVYEALKVLIK